MKEQEEGTRRSNIFDVKSRLSSVFGTFGVILYYVFMIIISFAPLWFLDFNWMIDTAIILAIVFIPVIGQLLDIAVWILSFLIVIKNPVGTAEILYYIGLAANIAAYVIPFISSLIVYFVGQVAQKRAIKAANRVTKSSDGRPIRSRGALAAYICAFVISITIAIWVTDDLAYRRGCSQTQVKADGEIAEIESKYEAAVKKYEVASDKADFYMQKSYRLSKVLREYYGYETIPYFV